MNTMNTLERECRLCQIHDLLSDSELHTLLRIGEGRYQIGDVAREIKRPAKLVELDLRNGMAKLGVKYPGEVCYWTGWHRAHQQALVHLLSF